LVRLFWWQRRSLLAQTYPLRSVNPWVAPARTLAAHRP
jgi:hypothetical protein